MEFLTCSHYSLLQSAPPPRAKSSVLDDDATGNESLSASSRLHDDEGPADAEEEDAGSDGGRRRDDEGEGLTNPGDFDDLEDSKSFRVQEVDGVFMMLISMLGTPGGQDREPAMLQVQFQLGSKSADASVVVQDTRMPSVQAMVTQAQPGAGRLLQLTAQHRCVGECVCVYVARTDFLLCRVLSAWNPSLRIPSALYLGASLLHGVAHPCSLSQGISLKGEAALGATMIAGGNVQVGGWSRLQ